MHMHAKSPLHGITVIVDTDSPKIYIGKCHEEDERRVLLYNAVIYEEGQDGKSKAEWITHAAKFGFFAAHDSITVPREQVAGITKLGDVPRL
jgi:hypothetical protein